MSVVVCAYESVSCLWLGLSLLYKSRRPCCICFAAGHSLGGALATLAAHDIRKQLLENEQSNTKVVCYTFAAPRTSNHAFAREYNAIVPDTWSIINDQVTQRSCFCLFSTARVFLN